MNVVVDGLMTNYQLSGKGKLVLLLHGWGDNSKGLDELTRQLSNDYQVLVPDLPGFGATQPPKDVWDLDNYAEFLTGLLNKLDLKQPFAIVGHSNGGALTIRSVAKNQLQPNKIVLIASSGIRDGGNLKRLILNIIAKTGNIATIWMPERYRQALRKSLYSTAGSDMLVAPGLEETFKKTVRQDVQSDAASLSVPTLLIYGTDDQAVPLEDGRKFNELIKDSKLEIIQDAGHFVHADDSENVLRLIKDFLK